LAPTQEPRSRSRPPPHISGRDRPLGLPFQQVRFNNNAGRCRTKTLVATLALAALIASPAVAKTFGSCASLMLTVILSIGPITRLDRRFLPLLYNRRHLGVLTFLIVCVQSGTWLSGMRCKTRCPTSSPSSPPSRTSWNGDERNRLRIESVEQCLCLLEVRRIETFGEPAVEGCQQVARLVPSLPFAQ
jgi:hypothetical protein